MSVFRVILVRIFPTFFRIPTEYGETQSISPYSVRMRKNTGKMRTRIALLKQWLSLIKIGFSTSSDTRFIPLRFFLPVALCLNLSVLTSWWLPFPTQWSYTMACWWSYTMVVLHESFIFCDSYVNSCIWWNL